MFSKTDTILCLMNSLPESAVEGWARASAFSQELHDRIGYLTLKDEGVNAVRTIGWSLADLNRFLEMAGRDDVDSFLEECDNKCKETLANIESKGLTPEDLELTFNEYRLFVSVAYSGLIEELWNQVSVTEDLDESTPGAIFIEEVKPGTKVSKFLQAAAGPKPPVDFSKYVIHHLGIRSQLHLRSDEYEVQFGVEPDFNLGSMLDQMVSLSNVREYLFDLEEFYNRVIVNHDNDGARAWSYIEQLASRCTTTLISTRGCRVSCVRFSGTNGDAVFVYVENNINNPPTLLYFPISYIEDRLKQLGKADKL